MIPRTFDSDYDEMPPLLEAGSVVAAMRRVFGVGGGVPNHGWDELCGDNLRAVFAPKNPLASEWAVVVYDDVRPGYVLFDVCRRDTKSLDNLIHAWGDYRGFPEGGLGSISTSRLTYLTKAHSAYIPPPDEYDFVENFFNNFYAQQANANLVINRLWLIHDDRAFYLIARYRNGQMTLVFFGDLRTSRRERNDPKTVIYATTKTNGSLSNNETIASNRFWKPAVGAIQQLSSLFGDFDGLNRGNLSPNHSGRWGDLRPELNLVLARHAAGNDVFRFGNQLVGFFPGWWDAVTGRNINGVSEDQRLWPLFTAQTHGGKRLIRFAAVESRNYGINELSPFFIEIGGDWYA